MTQSELNRRQELRLALGLKRSVEPRRPQDDGREIAAVVAALHQLLGFELRSPVPHIGRELRVFVEAVAGRMVGAERRVRRNMDEAGRADAPGAVEHELGSADVHVVQLAYVAGGMDHRGGVDHGRAADAVEELVDDGGVTYVAGDYFDAGIDDLEQRDVTRLTHQAPNAPPERLCGERANEVLAEPARGAGHHDGGSRDRG